MPEKKDIFQINETIECATFDKYCPTDVYFHITIYNDNVLTLDIPRGLGVVLDSRFVGFNIVICDSLNKGNISVQRMITVVSAPVKIDIVNEKSVLMVGDTLICEGWGQPDPSKSWWFVSGPQPLKVAENVLTVLPNSPSGEYIYDCVIENYHGKIDKRSEFAVFNKFKEAKDEAGRSRFFIYISLSFFLFAAMFVTFTVFVFGVQYKGKSKIA